MLLEKIEELLKEVNALTAQNAEEVEQLRIKYLSKKGEINALISRLPQCARRPEKRGWYQDQRIKERSP